MAKWATTPNGDDVEARLAAAGLRVKPLVWTGMDGESYRQATTPIGQYQVSWLGEHECWQLYRPNRPGLEWKDLFSRHASRAAAKAAADADHRARVLAMLEVAE